MIFYAVIKQENKQLIELSKRFYQLSIIDPLTGLYNRRFFFKVFEKEVEKSLRNNCVLSVAIGDFDNFKNINDEYGHEEGDKVLREVSQIIKDSLRKMDIPARIGGEEFVILLPQTDKKRCLHSHRTGAEKYCRKNKGSF